MKRALIVAVTAIAGVVLLTLKSTQKRENQTAGAAYIQPAEQPKREPRHATIERKTSERPPESPKPAANGLRAAATWRNVGNVNPQSAFESLFWSKEHIDTVVLASLISVTPELRRKAEEVFLGLPQANRSMLFINTPEQLVAWLYATSPLIEAFRVDQETATGPQSVRLTGQLQHERGRVVSFELDFRFEPGGWKLVLDDKRAGEMLSDFQRAWASAKQQN